MCDIAIPRAIRMKFPKRTEIREPLLLFLLFSPLSYSLPLKLVPVSDSAYALAKLPETFQLQLLGASLI